MKRLHPFCCWITDIKSLLSSCSNNDSLVVATPPTPLTPLTLSLLTSTHSLKRWNWPRIRNSRSHAAHVRAEDSMAALRCWRHNTKAQFPRWRWCSIVEIRLPVTAANGAHRDVYSSMKLHSQPMARSFSN